jgi:tRNA threonylcarbamoyladenosine biosynthesis protein TsaB
LLIASIDTSSPIHSAALLETSGPEARCLIQLRETAGEQPRIPGLLMDACDAAHLTLNQIEAYAIGLGPGRLSSVADALTTLKGMSLANRAFLVGVSSLHAMALQARKTLSGSLFAAVASNEGQCFVALFRADPITGVMVQAGPEMALSEAELSSKLESLSPARAIGYAPNADLRVTTVHPSAEQIAQLALLELPKLQRFDSRALLSLRATTVPQEKNHHAR